MIQVTPLGGVKKVSPGKKIKLSKCFDGAWKRDGGGGGKDAVTGAALESYKMVLFWDANRGKERILKKFILLLKMYR